MTKDMTQGSPLKLILAFAVPLMLGSLFQQFYNLADTIIVGRFVGVDALALGDMLVKTYKLEPKDSLYDLIQSIESYRALRNPTNTKHRFIVEDTMSGLVPLASVGHALGIPTPMMDAFVNIASAVCGRDFWKEGRTAEKLGMAGKTLEEIQEMVR